MNYYYVYFLTNWNNKVLYIGMTSHLERRLYEHRNRLVDGYTKRYHVDKLVYYEVLTDPRTAVERERQLKSWRREKKNALVERKNPQWQDLSESLWEDPSLRSG